MDTLLSFVKNSQIDENNSQSNLFAGSGIENKPSLRIELTDPATDKQKLSWEKELLGLYISEHPVREFESHLSGVVVPLADLENYPSNKNILGAGVISRIKKVITRSGEVMLFVKIEDTSGWTEILVFPSALKQDQGVWQEDKIILVNGRLSDKDGEMKIICNVAKEINQDNIEETINELSGGTLAINGGNFLSGILIDFSSPLTDDLTLKLKDLFSKIPGNKKVYLVVSNKRIETNTSIEYNEGVKREIEKLTGLGSVKAI